MSQLSELSLPSTEVDDYFGGSCAWCGLKAHGDVIDMDARFGRRWVIEWDDIGMRGSQCPWHRQIRCRYGFIAPCDCGNLGDDTIVWCDATDSTGVCSTRQASRAAKLLIQLSEHDPRYTLGAVGDFEATVTCKVCDLAKIVSILKPIRR